MVTKLLLCHRLHISLLLLPSLLIQALQILLPAPLPLTLETVKLIIADFTVLRPELLNCLVEDAIAEILSSFTDLH